MAVSFNLGLSEAGMLANAVTVGYDISTDKKFIIKEINDFKKSKKRADMIIGEKYYMGLHDILKRERMAIGEDGQLVKVENLPNNRIVDNQYKKMVDQKTNYLLGKPVTCQSDNQTYSDALKKVFNNKFQRLLKAIGEDSLNCGIAWMYVYYNDAGNIAFKRIKPYEVIPLWKDAEHTTLDGAIRVYEVIELDKDNHESVVEKVEVYDANGVSFFEIKQGDLIPCEPFRQAYITVIDEEGIKEDYNWTNIPLIPFKYNSKEIPLIKMVKSLQDGLNIIESNFQNAMEEDPRNTILVLVNYDGENLGEFRRNLSTYSAVKVRGGEGEGKGDLRSLTIEVNSENYLAILNIFKKAIMENAMGYDAKDDILAGRPNQMNIISMYSDIDLDASNMETEYQAGFEELLFFINAYLSNDGIGDFDDEDVDIIFNRDMLICETEVIENCVRSEGILSEETIVAMHPWVDDVEAEIERIKKQRKENEQLYGNAYYTGSDIDKMAKTKVKDNSDNKEKDDNSGEQG
jgi:SPP1 family phage portal protein